MAKKVVPASDIEQTEQINAYVPRDVKRRMKIAAANTGKTMTDLLLEWIEAGLAKVEKEQQTKR